MNYINKPIVIENTLFSISGMIAVFFIMVQNYRKNIILIYLVFKCFINNSEIFRAFTKKYHYYYMVL